ncbi:MAG: sodium:solute symporter family protein [Caldithrix sp.]|nr:sodium:solute symporter family protein [Caldithrix sp.]
MTLYDYIIFVVYFLAVLSVGVYFYRKNKDREDYYVGGRSMAPSHIGMSIVATDVGGGFSIGLGGLGFIMGLSGSWLLFTGLVGAWLAAVLIIPKIKAVDSKLGMLTFPDFLKHKYNKKVAMAAAIISAIGYLGFTSAQILAGAKLAAGSVFANIQWDIDPLKLALYVMAVIILLYTVLGGLKAVIYTDTIQWMILLGGLFFFGVPFAYFKAGGLSALQATLPANFFTLTNISWVQFTNWFFTIVPIWFIAMTLYQRIYATKSVGDAKKAFFVAGLLEYPIMSFIGVFLGMISRTFFPDVEAEMGLPMLLRDVLPIGITGVVIAAYFSAIMSTADSCLIASSGNFVNDLIEPYLLPKMADKHILRVSNLVTLIVGAVALLIASSFATVLEIILHAYSFMVAGLFIPTLGAYFWKKSHPHAALTSMLVGGTITLIFIFTNFSLPLGLDASIYGIAISAMIFFPYSYVLSLTSKTESIKNVRHY